MPKFDTVTHEQLSQSSATDAVIKRLRDNKITYLTLDLTAVKPTADTSNTAAILNNMSTLFVSLRGNFDIDTIDIKTPSDAPDATTVPDHWLFRRGRARDGDVLAGLIVGGTLGVAGGLIASITGGLLVSKIFSLAFEAVFYAITVSSTVIGLLWGVTKPDRQDALYGNSKACSDFNDTVYALLNTHESALAKVSSLGLELISKDGEAAYNKALVARLKTVFGDPKFTDAQKEKLWATYKNTPVGYQIESVVFPEPLTPPDPAKTFLMSQGVGERASADQGGPAHGVRQRKAGNSPSQ